MDDVIGSPDLDEDKSIPVASCKTKYGSKSRGQKKKTIKGRFFFFSSIWVQILFLLFGGDCYNSQILSDSVLSNTFDLKFWWMRLNISEVTSKSWFSAPVPAPVHVRAAAILAPPWKTAVTRLCWSTPPSHRCHVHLKPTTTTLKL